MTEGIDYSFARPGGAALQAAGKTFAMRYVTGDGGKGLDEAELQDLLAHGLSVGLVFESTAGRALDGFAAGSYDASCSQRTIQKLGLPRTLPVYFAVDFAATPDNQAAIDDYLRGAASVLGASRVGVYGSYDVVQRCDANHTARYLWQTYAWSGGRLYAGAHLYQYSNGVNINGEVDLTRALQADCGLYSPSGGGLSDMDTHQIARDLYQVLTGSVPSDDIINQKADFITATGNSQQVIKDILNAGIEHNETINVWALATYYANYQLSAIPDPHQCAIDRVLGGDFFAKVMSVDIPDLLSKASQLNQLLEKDAPQPQSDQDKLNQSAIDALKTALGGIK